MGNLARAVGYLGSMAALLCAPGCLNAGGGEGAGAQGSALCNQAAQRLRACELLSDGELGCGEADDFALCQVDCLNQSACSDIETFFCGLAADDDTVLRATTFGQCVQRCVDSQRSGFVCDDGDTIPEDFVCDADPDCEGGEDERDCEGQEPDFECWDDPNTPGCNVFTCDSGERIPEDWRCDGGGDCRDESDEAGCPKKAEVLCMGRPVDQGGSSSTGVAAADGAATSPQPVPMPVPMPVPVPVPPPTPDPASR